MNSAFSELNCFLYMYTVVGIYSISVRIDLTVLYMYVRFRQNHPDMLLSPFLCNTVLNLMINE